MTSFDLILYMHCSYHCQYGPEDHSGNIKAITTLMLPKPRYKPIVLEAVEKNIDLDVRALRKKLLQNVRCSLHVHHKRKDKKGRPWRMQTETTRTLISHLHRSLEPLKRGQNRRRGAGKGRLQIPQMLPPSPTIQFPPFHCIITSSTVYYPAIPSRNGLGTTGLCRTFETSLNIDLNMASPTVNRVHGDLPSEAPPPRNHDDTTHHYPPTAIARKEKRDSKK